MCKKYATDRAPLTGKKDGKAIKRLNAAQRMHEGLNHQDVVALEQEYGDKLAQFNERARKTLKVGDGQLTSNNVFNEVPTTIANNTVHRVNEEPTNNCVPCVNEVNNEEDRFVGMHPAAFDN